MKRYTIRADSGVSSTGANIFESATGYWVSYSDHEAALAEAVAKEREAIIKIVQYSYGMGIGALVESIRARGDK